MPSRRRGDADLHPGIRRPVRSRCVRSSTPRGGAVAIADRGPAAPRPSLVDRAGPGRGHGRLGVAAAPRTRKAVKEWGVRKVVLFMHMSLDGFVAGPNGEMDWIIVNDEMFEYAGQRTREADTALYGRVTYEMMEGYWPTAADQPGATKHDIEHSRWYNQVLKVVVSRTMKGARLANTM